MNRILISPDAASRLDAAAEWLKGTPRDAEVLLVAPNWEAADDLLRRVVSEEGTRFGVSRLSLNRLASRLASPELARTARAAASQLSLVAVTARVVHATLDRLSYFAPVARLPGFPVALSRTASELRMNQVEAKVLEPLPDVGADLALLLGELHTQLDAAGLADRAVIFHAAVEAVQRGDRIPKLLLLLDQPISTKLEASLVRAVAERCSSVLATVPTGDTRTLDQLRNVLGCSEQPVTVKGATSSLASLKEHVFETTSPARAILDNSVSFRSWPGEARECTEIARAIQSEAQRGVRFDQMAVFLRSPAEYQAHLEEALRRASIPTFFATGARRPDPAGRAFLSLLRCAAEKLSARRFAEYLSLGQVPQPTRSPADGAAWVPSDDELSPVSTSRDGSTPESFDPGGPQPPSPASEKTDDTFQAPWRWEKLIVEAAVIGGKARWEKRLAGLAAELRLKREELKDESESRARQVDQQIRDLEQLSRLAFPIIARLDSLPDVASWADWLTHLRDLATFALRKPEAVLATLAELEPMSPVGPADLDEVELVLAPRLAELSVPPARRRYGAVYVAPSESARGLSFQVVFIPGLAEKLFPRKVTEDPILLDSRRKQLSVSELTTSPDRAANERLALRLATGAARERVYLSYPRVDLEQARARVPSFYGLETFRAAEGSLPGFEELSTRAESGIIARLGWPAPVNPSEAVDEAEYDLALLSKLQDADPVATVGAANYLLTANPHLGRALRARARRWLRRWTTADGLVDPDAPALAALGKHQLSARSFSPTSLQNFAYCPYKFFLNAVHQLRPEEEPSALEVIDPLTRGTIFHAVQFELLTRLRSEGLLPVRPPVLDTAFTVADAVLDSVAARYQEELAPAITRVWDDGIAGIRADLREWLRREAENPEGWEPYRFELSFGLDRHDRSEADPSSVRDPVAVLGMLKLRGSIDLVERHPRGVLRATDHKTGKARAAADVIVGGGEVLQPVLYALACEGLFPEPVDSGRLYYCTAAGEYQERVVPLDDESRETARAAVEIIKTALVEGFLPAAPRRQACAWCDYRPVCGPYEEIRSARKPAKRLADLRRLRDLP